MKVLLHLVLVITLSGGPSFASRLKKDANLISKDTANPINTGVELFHQGNEGSALRPS